MCLFIFFLTEHFSSNPLYTDRKNILPHRIYHYKQIFQLIRFDFNNLTIMGELYANNQWWKRPLSG